MKQLPYEEWRAIYREMALRYYAADCAEMMIPLSEGRARAKRLQAKSDAANGMPGSPPQDGEGIQDWRKREHDMGAALIALQDMGYTISK